MVARDVRARAVARHEVAHKVTGRSQEVGGGSRGVRKQTTSLGWKTRRHP